jgi:ferrochelatase
LARNESTAVVLFQLGGPDRPEAVEPFLYNLFCDPDIIDLPGAFLIRKKLAKLISTLRAPKVVELYRQIGGKSPILDQTEEQARSIKSHLAQMGIDIPVYIAMRYWHPMTDEVLARLIREGVGQLILLPLYPHYSKATTGSAMNELLRILKRDNQGGRLRYTLIHSYPEHPMYIKALTERIKDTLIKFDPKVRNQVYLIFSAHGTPLKLVREGDPYSHQVRLTYEAVMNMGNFDLPSVLCFQSKVGPQRWLEPSLVNTIEKLAGDGVKQMLIIPISFVSEHIETLSEIGIEARHQANSLGVENFEVMPALRVHPRFIQCLAELILDKLGELRESKS